MYYLFIASAQVTRLDLGIIIASLTLFIAIWRILNNKIGKKADKDDLKKLEMDLKQECLNIEKRNIQQHKEIREEFVRLVGAVNEKLDLISKWITNGKYN